MPQPLRQWPDDITFGANAIGARPTLASGIASIAAAWAEIEVCVGILLSAILHTEMRTGISMYLSLKGSAAQDAALAAAAAAKLPIDLKCEFDTLMTNMRKRGKERNKVVHGLWGVSPQLPDVLINCQPEHFIRDLAEAYSMDMPSGPSPAARGEFVSVLMAYDSKDFMAIMNRLRDLEGQLEELARMASDAHEQRLGPVRAPMPPPDVDVAAVLPTENQTRPKEPP